jgi:hypothetical protein
MSNINKSEARALYKARVINHRNGVAKIVREQNAHRFSVKSVPLFTEDGVPANAWGNVREDSNVVIGVTSERYGILQNNELEDVILNGLKGRNLQPTETEGIVASHGSRVHVRYDFRDEAFEVPTSKRGDIICLRLITHNSFNGSSPASVSVGAVRLVCTNGMTSFSEELTLTSKHNSSIRPEFALGVLDSAILQWDALKRQTTTLASKRITDTQGFNAIENIVGRGLIGEHVGKRVLERWKSPSFEHDSERTMWNLYNAFTEVFTHDASIHKYESNERKSGRILSALYTASEHEDSGIRLLDSIDQAYN